MAKVRVGVAGYGTIGQRLADGVAMTPLREGGTGSQSQSVLQPQELPERYESGTLNLPGIAGLLQGLSLIHI